MAKLKFSVDSALLSELGEYLVESPHVALLELVKNAYDADASVVTVRIVPQSGKGPTVEVVDDGAGMTFEQVESYWMRIATTHKVEDDVSPIYGRPRTGSKGIGRFSCRRLGTRLTLSTTARPKGKPVERTKVLFDWKAFAPGSELTDIDCDGERSRPDSAETGTVLVISGALSDEWSKRGLSFLKRQFAVLAANRGARRRGYQEDPGFNVRFEAPGFSEKIENLRDKFVTAGWGDLSAEVAEDGTASVTLKAMRIGTRSITYPLKVPKLAGVKARIGILYVLRDEFRDKSVLSQATLREILKDWGGVYVRHSGFRVYPYGEPGDDWLQIDKDRGRRVTGVSDLLKPFAAKLDGVDPHRALLQLSSNSNYVGDVEINQGSAYFQMKASREGFRDSPEVDELRDFVRFTIDWAAIYRDYYLRVTQRDDADVARKVLEEEIRAPVEPDRLVEQAVDVVEKEVKSLSSRLPAPERQSIVRGIRTATEAIRQHDKSNRQELQHLRLVASTSTLLLIFSHEVKVHLSALEEMNITLERVQRQLSGAEAHRIEAVRTKLVDTKLRFIDLLKMTSLISVDSRKAEPEMLALKTRVEQAKQCFALVTKSYDINVVTDGVPNSIVVGKMLEAELYAVLLNIFSNSIKSVIAGGGTRKVQVDAHRADGRVVIHVRDTGVGLDEKQFEEVFVPFIADPEEKLYRGLKHRLNPEDKYIVGSGSGLGLSIVREIVAARKGSVRFLKPVAPWKADLEVTLP